MSGNQGDGIALRHLGEQVQEQSQRGRWHGYCFRLFAVIENLDADARPFAELMGRQAAAGLPREPSLGLARSNRLKALGKECGHDLLSPASRRKEF
jgi:hypothetical protein